MNSAADTEKRPQWLGPSQTITHFYLLDALLTGNRSGLHSAAAQAALPVITLAIVVMAPIMRTVRGSAADALKGRRPVLLELGFVETAIYDRERLGVGVRLAGPCIVKEESATTVVRAGQRLAVDEYGNLILEA